MALLLGFMHRPGCDIFPVTKGTMEQTNPSYADSLEQLHIHRDGKPLKYYSHQLQLSKGMDGQNFPQAVVVKKHRGAGFTTAALHMMLWQCLTFENQKCAYFCHSEAAKNLVRNALLSDVHHSMNSFNCPTIFRDDSFTVHGTGSTIYFMAPKDGPIRTSLDFVVIDEPSVVAREEMDALWSRLLGNIAIKGNCLIGSTPNGTHSKNCEENWFYQTWRRPNSFRKLCWSIENTEIAARHPERLEAARKTMTDLMFAQEWEGKFLIQPKHREFVVGSRPSEYVRIETDKDGNWVVSKGNYGGKSNQSGPAITFTQEEMEGICTKTRKLKPAWTRETDPLADIDQKAIDLACEAMKQSLYEAEDLAKNVYAKTRQAGMTEMTMRQLAARFNSNGIPMKDSPSQVLASNVVNITERDLPYPPQEVFPPVMLDPDTAWCTKGILTRYGKRKAD